VAEADTDTAGAATVLATVDMVLDMAAMVAGE